MVTTLILKNRGVVALSGFHIRRFCRHFLVLRTLALRYRSKVSLNFRRNGVGFLSKVGFIVRHHASRK